METVRDLNEDTLEGLQDLIQLNIDSAEGFRDAAEKVDDNALSSLFSRLSQERFTQSQELKRYVGMNGEEPEDSGTAKGTVHRLWMDLRAAINGGDPKVILIEAERGEDAIKEKYEEVLKETAGSPLNGVLQRQYVAVKSGHDKVRDLRDAHKN